MSLLRRKLRSPQSANEPNMNENKRMRFHLNSPSFRNFIQIRPDLCTAWNVTRTSGFGKKKKKKRQSIAFKCCSEFDNAIKIYCLAFTVQRCSKSISWCFYLKLLWLWQKHKIFTHLYICANKSVFCPRFHLLAPCQDLLLTFHSKVSCVVPRSRRTSAANSGSLWGDVFSCTLVRIVKGV